MGADRKIVSIAVSDRDAPHVAMAAAMLVAERPEIEVAVKAGLVVVAGPGRASSLRSRWTAALLNERLVAEATERRSLILAELVA